MVPLLSEELVPSSFGEAFGPLPSLSENLPLIEEMPLIEGMPLIEEPSGAYVLRGQRKELELHR
jgi:hypothetical protein